MEPDHDNEGDGEFSKNDLALSFARYVFEKRDEERDVPNGVHQ